MTIRGVVHSPSTRANIDRAIEFTEPHLRPVLAAVRDFGVGMLFVGQSADPFRIPPDPKRPAIVIIGDDFDRAVGPSGFHMPSVRRAIRASSAFAVVSCEPLQHVYAAVAAAAALTRRNTMLIETRPEYEIQWAGLIRKLAPKCPLTMAVVEGGHA